MIGSGGKPGLAESYTECLLMLAGVSNLQENGLGDWSTLLWYMEAQTAMTLILTIEMSRVYYMLT